MHPMSSVIRPLRDRHCIVHLSTGCARVAHFTRGYCCWNPFRDSLVMLLCVTPDLIRGPEPSGSLYMTFWMPVQARHDKVGLRLISGCMTIRGFYVFLFVLMYFAGYDGVHAETRTRTDLHR